MDPEPQLIERLDAALPATGRVLAVDAGNGQTARRLAGDGRRVVALEAAAGMTAQCDEHPDVTFVQGVAGELPFADGSFDAAYVHVSPAVVNSSRGVAELHRVVRPGGAIVIVVGDGEPADGLADRGYAVAVVEPRLGQRALVTSTASRGPSPVRVRGMRLAEADRVGRLTLDAYDRFGAIGGDYRDWLRDPLLRLDTVTALLVAVVDGEVAGTVTYVEPGDGEWEGPEPPHGDSGFRVLAVAPEAQGRGVGPRLVEACKQRAREAGRRRLFISSMTWMTRAHRMYERAGFVRRPDLDVMFPGGPGVIFTHDLRDDAADVFPPPGPVPDAPPWYAEAWAGH